MRDVTVLADDLTGAADCGIAFVVAGLPAFVSFGDAPPPASARIVALDLDTRWRPAQDARERARAATVAALRDGARVLYKKVDSTLRGHVGAELAAMVHAVAEHAGGKAPLCIVAPAFPATGRTTRGGRVFVGGEPLETTEVWRTSGMSGSADLVTMLRAAGLEAAVVAPAALGVESRLDAAICDATSDDELRAIVEAGVHVARQVIWVGSAGLARHLPPFLGLRTDAPKLAGPARRTLPQVLTLVGSRSTLAREQAQRLVEDRGIERVVLDEAVLLSGPRSPEWSRAAAALEASLARGEDPLLLIAMHGEVDLSLASALAAGLARLAAPHARRIGGLVATGGDIARAALDALGATGLHLVGEVEPGVPLGFTDTEPPIAVVTKAGAFGTKEVLSRSRAALKRILEEPRAGAPGERSGP
jgi:uncharacterized protein YgbK (DUF1537 family)